MSENFKSLPHNIPISPAQLNIIKINRYKKILKNEANFKDGPILQLHFYSNHAGRLVLGGGSDSYWNTETYAIESIKEFEQVSTAWKNLLSELLRKGSQNIKRTNKII